MVGTEKAADQGRAMGHDEAHIFLTSGMILRPDFYVDDNSDPVALRREMGLREGLTTAIVLFGGHRPKRLFHLTAKPEAPWPPPQFTFPCRTNTEHPPHS